MWALYDALLERVDADDRIEYVRAGVSWVLVRTEKGALGVASVPQGNLGQPVDESTYRGMPLREAARLVKRWDFRQAALGLAAVNAAINRTERFADCGEPDAFLRYRDRAQGRRVAVVGRFQYLEERLKPICDLSVLERAPIAGEEGRLHGTVRNRQRGVSGRAGEPVFLEMLLHLAEADAEILARLRVRELRPVQRAKTLRVGVTRFRKRHFLVRPYGARDELRELAFGRLDALEVDHVDDRAATHQLRDQRAAGLVVLGRAEETPAEGTRVAEKERTVRDEEQVPRALRLVHEAVDEVGVGTVEVHNHPGVRPLPEGERRGRDGLVELAPHRGVGPRVVRLARAVAADVVIALHHHERQVARIGALHELHRVVEHPLVRGLVVAVALHEVAELEHEAGVGGQAGGGGLQQARTPIRPHVAVAHELGALDAPEPFGLAVVVVVRMVGGGGMRVVVRVAEQHHGVGARLPLRERHAAAEAQRTGGTTLQPIPAAEPRGQIMRFFHAASLS